MALATLIHSIDWTDLDTPYKAVRVQYMKRGGGYPAVEVLDDGLVRVEGWIAGHFNGQRFYLLHPLESTVTECEAIQSLNRVLKSLALIGR